MSERQVKFARRVVRAFAAKMRPGQVIPKANRKASERAVRAKIRREGRR